MSAEAPLLTRSFKVGHRTCTVSVPRPVAGSTMHCVFEWAPDVPVGARLTAAEWQQYRGGRNAALAEIAKALQITVAVVEV